MALRVPNNRAEKETSRFRTQKQIQRGICKYTNNYLYTVTTVLKALA